MARRLANIERHTDTENEDTSMFSYTLSIHTVFSLVREIGRAS